MTAEQWLMLTDYASKYRISVSTLRRRIKGQQIPFRFEGGKYYVLDAPPTHPEIASFGRETPIFPGLKTLPVEPVPTKSQAHIQASPAPTPPTQTSFETARSTNEMDHWSMQKLQNLNDVPAAEPALSRNQVDEPLISTATKLLNELKRAYMSILQEKEEQIIQLKEEVSDLKTLVRVLEEDNDRMRRILTPAPR